MSRDPRYGVQYSFSVRSEKLPEVQQVVKRYNLRFLGNPARLAHHPTQYITVGCNDAPPADFSAAVREIETIRKPGPTIAKPGQTGLSRLLGLIRGLRAKVSFCGK